MKRNIEPGDDGYIVVETVGAFIPFLLLVISILSLVNIVTLQVRIHYALTQTAGALSVYCYTAYAAGISDELSSISASGAGIEGNLNSMLEGIRSFGGVSDAAGNFLDMTGNPEDTIFALANLGIDKARNAASSAFVTPLFHRYLTGSNMTADEYLSRLRVTDFAITECAIIDADDNVRLTASYEVEYTFGGLKLPFTPTLRISQSAVTKAWLGGSGDGYMG